MVAAVLRVAFASLLIAGIACSHDVRLPNAPSVPAAGSTVSPNTPPAQPPGEFVPRFPAVSAAARIYVASNWPVYSMHGSPLASRFVLYDDGTFTLQYSSLNYPFFEYRGNYKDAGGLITFNFGSGFDGATATLSGNRLAVRFSVGMQQADFQNDVYVSS